MASVRPAAHSADRDYLAQGLIRRSRLDLRAGNSARIGGQDQTISVLEKFLQV
jgi:hypothetical protein